MPKGFVKEISLQVDSLHATDMWKLQTKFCIGKIPSGLKGWAWEDSRLPSPVCKGTAVAGVGEAGLHECHKIVQTGKLF